MIEFVSKTKRWGTSLAFIIPKNIVDMRHLRPNQEIRILLEENNDILNKTFGILKGKINKSTDEIMKEIDEELWSE